MAALTGHGTAVGQGGTAGEALAALAPAEARARFAAGLVQPTSGWCAGYAQANVIAVPRELAFDMLLFAQRNPKPCPVLDVIEAGEVRGRGAEGATVGVLDDPQADIRTDLPAYRVFRGGELVEEVADAREAWREDLVTFIIGCSFTFEHPLLAAGVPVRHLTAGRNVPMYRTSRRCRSPGALGGPLVVSLRGIPPDRVADAVRISSRYPMVHGAPVHVGDPAALGIADLDRPDFGDAPLLEPGDVPVFLGVRGDPSGDGDGVAARSGGTHAPGHMLITDAQDSDYLAP